MLLKNSLREIRTGIRPIWGNHSPTPLSYLGTSEKCLGSYHLHRFRPFNYPPMGHDGDDAWSAFKPQITYNYLKVTIFSDNFVQQFSSEALAIANYGDFHLVLCLRVGGGGGRTHCLLRCLL